jgi:hypothetical protein
MACSNITLLIRGYPWQQLSLLNSGMIKISCYGFSWTYLFFGWFVPLFRGELGVAALHMLFSIITLGLWQIIVAFLYNKQYMTRMFMAGWVLADSDGNNEMAAQRLGVVLPKRGRR